MTRTDKKQTIIIPPVKWAVLIDYACLVVLLSVAPPEIFRVETAIVYFPHADKVIHFAIYGVFAMLMLWALHKNNSVWIPIVITGALVFLFGCAMEFLQPLVMPGERFFSWADMFSNGIGAAFGIFLLTLFSRFRNFMMQKLLHTAHRD